MKRFVKYSIPVFALFFVFLGILLVYTKDPLEQAFEIFEHDSLSGASLLQCKPIITKEFLRASGNISVDQEIDSFSDEELEALEQKRFACLDQHSRFHSQWEMARLNERMEGNFGGIGALLKNDSDAVIIESVMSGNPAERAGLKKGDVIVSIQNAESSQIIKIQNISHAVSVLHGKVGSVVFIHIARGVENLTLTVTREKIKLSTVSFQKLNSGVGYVQVTGHNEETADDFEEALRSFSKTEKETPRVIVDMRDNPGGTLYSSLEMLFYFSDNPKDIVTTLRERRKEDEKTIESLTGTFEYPKTREKKKPGAFKDYKVIILVNNRSASAAEMFSGTMQDWGNAHGKFTVLGSRSYGKGVGQTVYKLSNGVGLKLTTFEFLVGNGKQKIQDIGVIPTKEVKDTRKIPEDTLTEEDAQFIAALETVQSMSVKEQ